MSNTAQAPSRATGSQKSVFNTVNVITIVDTDIIKSTYGPNAGPGAAQGLNHHEGITMLCAAKNFKGDINNDPANLEFSANVGDFVSFWATTVSNDADDAVIIYDISSTSQVNVFNTFQSNVETRSGAAIPDTSKQNGLPALQINRSFYSFDSKIKNSGTEAFVVSFAIYELDAAREKQTLYGCYYWDPTIIVQ